MLANETERLSPVIIVFLCDWVPTLFKGTFFQFDNDFTGLGVEGGILLQCTF